MKLRTLKIRDFRGVKQLDLDLGDHNALVSGPNGSGKSGVIDAIEFLFKGGVSRLAGEGTGGLSLQKHGPHVDSKPDLAVIEAEISLGTKRATIQRCVKTPDQIKVLAGNEDEVRAAFAAMAKREFALSRREIVAFITAPPKERLQQIQVLLNLGAVEATRASLQKAKNQYEKSAKVANTAVKEKQREIGTLFGLAKFDGAKVRTAVNEVRKAFAAEAITEIRSTSVKAGIKYTPGALQVNVNWSQLDSDLQLLTEQLGAEGQAERRQAITASRSVFGVDVDLNGMPKVASMLQLVELGQALVNDDLRECPLCDLDWSAPELAGHLSDKRANLLAKSETILVFRSKIDELQLLLDTPRILVARIHTAAQTLGDLVVAAALHEWSRVLESAVHDLVAAKTTLVIGEILERSVTELALSTPAETALAKLRERVPKKKDPGSELQDQWDKLTRAELLFAQVQELEGKEQTAITWAERSRDIYECYLSARDKVLQSLYDSIRDRFAVLYRVINQSDESGFGAVLKPTESGLDLTVDFYGRGQHPPHALHSEGHQDGMGLCLFMALAERLNSGIIDVIVLDDVVMSVDASHRQSVAQLLITEFKQFQFVITTHERVWAMQIKNYGLVPKNNHWAFAGWTVSDGPSAELVEDYFDVALKLLEKNQVNEAAGVLRRNLEREFDSLCDDFRGAVPYNSHHQWTLGPLKDGTTSKYRKLLDKANKAAKSWSNSLLLAEIEALQSRLSKAMAECAREGWILNPTVHYNEWATFEPSELKSLILGYQELIACFRCQHCQNPMLLSCDGMDEKILHCACGKSSYGLVIKS